MQITVSIRGQVREVDVVVDHPDACVGDLVEALEPGRGLDGEGLVVAGRWFAPDVALDDTHLHDGAAVAVGLRPDGSPPPEEPVTEGLVVAVVNGPASGPAVTLPEAGELVVGRSEEADLTVADPALSSRHASLCAEPEGTVAVVDLGSTNGTAVAGHLIAGPRTVEPGTPVEVGSTTLLVRHASRADRPIAVDANGHLGPIPFNRPPRPAGPPEPAPVTLPDPPPDDEAKKVPFNLIAILAPLAMAAVMVRITGRIQFALFSLMSPVMAIGNYVATRRKAGKEVRRAGGSYRSAVAALERDLTAAAAAELVRRHEVVPDPAEVMRRALLPSTRLWQRRPDHADFLRMRVGLGTVEWNIPHRGSDAARATPGPEVKELLERHRRIPDSPVPVDLRAGVVGIVGDRAAALALARSLLCQAAVHQGPADLPVLVLTDERGAVDWDWAKWLPHVRDASGSSRALAGDRPTAESILAGLSAQADARAEARRSALAPGPPTGPVHLYVIDDVGLLEGRRARARDLLRSPHLPAAGVVLAPTEDRLPAVCSTVVTVSAAGDAVVRRPSEGLVLDDVVIAGMTEPTARAVARAMARFEDPEMALPGAGLPALVRLPPLLGIEPTDPAAVLTAWRQRLPDPGTSTPIGVGEDGVLAVDLRDDGPHALVGGTTGSGKSELLRGLVAGMAVNADPDHVVFVLVDYKGGSAFDACARLPHVVGMVTDLDEHLGERALRSLEAELRRRERMLRDAGATDLPEYLKSGSALGPLPRLVVVIDEFATLAGELPDFLGALVGIAQRGRSLGVHLLLATQRPQGAVNANIKANTNLRIALRVQDDADSRDIIDRADAAAISRATPGRAYVRRGPGEVELVQTVLATAVAAGDATAPVRVAPFRFGPVSSPAPPTAAQGSAASDLAVIVDTVIEAHRLSGLAPPRRPWVEMLATEIDLDDIAPAVEPGEDGQAGHVVFALADDPDEQRQVATGWDLTDGHVAVFGQLGAGTTTAGMAIAASLAATRSPDDLHLYGVDMGAGGLAPLRSLPHTGAVIAANEREAMVRLVRFLRSELDRRRQLSPEALADEPVLVTIVDGIGALLGELDPIADAETSDAFKRVVADGPAVSVLLVLLGDRPGALPMRLAASVGQRLLGRLADPNEYAAAGLRRNQVPVLPPGRFVHTATGLVAQVGLPGDLARRGDAARARHGHPRRPPVRVGTLPAEVRVEDLPAPSRHDGTWILPVGIAEDDLTPVALEVQPGEHLVVAGPPRSGVPEALALIARLVRDVDPATVIVGLCEPGSPLVAAGVFDGLGDSTSMDRVLALAATDARPWWVLIDEALHVTDPSGHLAAALASRRRDLHVVVGADPDGLRRAYTHWSRPARQSRSGLLLAPNLSTDGDTFGTRLPRSLPVPLVPGRGFVANGGATRLAQLATTQDSGSDLGDRSPMTS